MKISAQSNHKQVAQPSFNKLMLIQVKKSAFDHLDSPRDLQKISDVFNLLVEDIVKSRKNMLSRILDKMWLSDPSTINYLEQPKYVDLWQGAKKSGGDLEWLSLNIKTKIKKPLDADYHSFYVYTDVEKGSAFSQLSPITSLKIENCYKLDFKHKLKKGKVVNNPLWITAKTNNHLMKNLKVLHTNAGVERRKIDNLSQLDGLF